MELDLSDATVAFLRRQVEALFPDTTITAKIIAENIAFGAAVAGAGHIELVDEAGWWFVASETNWLANGKHGSIDELFRRIVPFPEQGPSSHRAEVYVTALAKSAYYHVDDATTWIHRGGFETNKVLPHVGLVPTWCSTVLAYRLAPL